MTCNDYVVFDKNCTFLVTGGAGFIGSNLCEYLVERGYKVKCLDNFSTGKIENIERLLSFKNFELINGDITDLSCCVAVTKNVDYVLHQAAWGSVPRSVKFPLDYNKNNITGTLNMLEASRMNGVKKFVFASSSSVYGDEPNLPKKEDRIGKVLSPYALTKKTNEEFARLYFELYGLETIGLRYFNVFGRRQDPNSLYAAVIPKFIKLLLNGEQPIINGDGSYSRDFTYIDNVIEGNLKACIAPKEASGQVFNIAYGGRVTIKQLFDTISAELDLCVQPIYSKVREGDIPHSNADISKAKKYLNYCPRYSFYDGISLAIGWYKKFLSGKEDDNR